MDTQEAQVRACNGCTACCFTHGVEELNKPVLSLCSQCDAGTGCRIYTSRPPSCAGFLCGWREGMGEEEDRPDKIGISWSWAKIKHYADEPHRLLVFETHRGSSRGERAQAFIERMLAGGSLVQVFLVDHWPARQYHVAAAPEHLLFAERMEQRGYFVVRHT